MRHAAILDVLRAVKQAADVHPEIAVWWYAPERRLQLSGDRGGPRGGFPAIEIVVQARPAQEVDCDLVAAELESRLPGESFAVRSHLGIAETQRLYRLKSGEEPAGADSLLHSS